MTDQEIQASLVRSLVAECDRLLTSYDAGVIMREHILSLKYKLEDLLGLIDPMIESDVHEIDQL